MVILVSSVTTYIYFYLKVKDIRQAETKANYPNTSKQRTLLWKKFKIPALMVSTFILFNIPGKILYTVASFMAFDVKTNLLYDIAYLLDMIAFSADAFFYMFLQKEVRRQLQLWRKKSNKIETFKSNWTYKY